MEAIGGLWWKVMSVCQTLTLPPFSESIGRSPGAPRSRGRYGWSSTSPKRRPKAMCACVGLAGDEDHLVREQQPVQVGEPLVGQGVQVDAVDLGAQGARDEPYLRHEGSGHRCFLRSWARGPVGAFFHGVNGFSTVDLTTSHRP